MTFLKTPFGFTCLHWEITVWFCAGGVRSVADRPGGHPLRHVPARKPMRKAARLAGRSGAGSGRAERRRGQAADGEPVRERKTKENPDPKTGV